MKIITQLPKLLRLAFDPAAADGEAVNAATIAVRQARRHKMSFAQVADLIAPERQLPPPVMTPDALNIVMSFGKHDGETLGHIAQNDLSYLAWGVRELREKHPDLAAAMETVLNWYTGGGEG